MAKNFELIPGERRNWEIAIFLLIDHVNPGIRSGQRFSRTGISSTMRSLQFIRNLLEPIGYEVNNTLSASISSAMTKIRDLGYVEYVGNECMLTESGFKRLSEIINKFANSKKVPIGKEKVAHDMAELFLSLPEYERAEVIRKAFGDKVAEIFNTQISNKS